MTLCAGPLAISLACLLPNDPAIEEAYAYVEDTWPGRTVDWQMRYARFLRDTSGALEIVAGAGPERGRLYACAALADAHAVAELPRLESISSMAPRLGRALTETKRRLTGSRSDPGSYLVWELGIWHDNEPIGEFPELFQTLLLRAEDVAALDDPDRSS
jgi:hypothetical protein